MNEAEKLAAALDSRVVRNWVHSTGTSPKATGFRHDAECQQAAALLRRQADQIKELREALEVIADDYADRFDLECPSTNPGIKSSIRRARSALAATKEET